MELVTLLSTQKKRKIGIRETTRHLNVDKVPGQHFSRYDEKKH